MWPSEKNIPAVQSSEAVAWRHLRLRPTGLGFGLSAMVGLLWLAGLNYQANLAYVAAFWLLGFIIAAVLQNVQQLLGLRPEWQMPAELFAGTSATVKLAAEGKTRPRRLWAKTDTDTTWRQWRLSDGLEELELPLETRLRGYLRVPEIELACAAPFGICTVSAIWQGQSDKIVYPAPLAHDVPTAFHADETRETQAVFVTSSDDLSHLQAHEDGMPTQHIAWKAYAKTGQLLDKRFDAAEQGGGSHIISYRDYPQGSGIDMLAAWLCWRVLEAERTGAPYELELPNQRIAPQKGQREMSLTALALW